MIIHYHHFYLPSLLHYFSSGRELTCSTNAFQDKLLTALVLKSRTLWLFLKFFLLIGFCFTL